MNISNWQLAGNKCQGITSVLPLANCWWKMGKQGLNKQEWNLPWQTPLTIKICGIKNATLHCMSSCTVIWNWELHLETWKGLNKTCFVIYISSIYIEPLGSFKLMIATSILQIWKAKVVLSTIDYYLKNCQLWSCFGKVWGLLSSNWNLKSPNIDVWSFFLMQVNFQVF